MGLERVIIHKMDREANLIITQTIKITIVFKKTASHKIYKFLDLLKDILIVIKTVIINRQEIYIER